MGVRKHDRRMRINRLAEMLGRLKITKESFKRKRNHNKTALWYEHKDGLKNSVPRNKKCHLNSLLCPYVISGFDRAEKRMNKLQKRYEDII